MARPVRTPIAVIARLKSLAIEDGRPRTEIAAAAGMSKSAIGRVLDEDRPGITLDTVGRVLHALGRSWADLD